MHFGPVSYRDGGLKTQTTTARLHHFEYIFSIAQKGKHRKRKKEKEERRNSQTNDNKSKR